MIKIYVIPKDNIKMLSPTDFIENAIQILNIKHCNGISQTKINFKLKISNLENFKHKRCKLNNSSAKLFTLKFNYGNIITTEITEIDRNEIYPIVTSLFNSFFTPIKFSIIDSLDSIITDLKNERVEKENDKN